MPSAAQRREFHEALLDAEQNVAGGIPGDVPRQCRVRSTARRLAASRRCTDLCWIRTIWRCPPQRQAGIVSVRVGTEPHVTCSHDWQTCSATAGMPSIYPLRDALPSPQRPGGGTKAPRNVSRVTGRRQRCSRPVVGSSVLGGSIEKKVVRVATNCDVCRGRPLRATAATQCRWRPAATPRSP